MRTIATSDPKFYIGDLFDKIEELGERTNKWYRGFGNKREIDRIHKQLVKNPKLLIDTKDKFEKAFGVDTASRTPKQWQNLVRVYGLDTVCKQEKMTKDQVTNKTIETFSQRVRAIR